jgi:hypothetical protein
VAATPQVPAVPDDVVYGFGRMDDSGRVGDRAMTGVLGWQPGDRLTLTADAGVVFARRDPGGMVTIPGKPYPTHSPQPRGGDRHGHCHHRHNWSGSLIRVPGWEIETFVDNGLR